MKIQGQRYRSRREPLLLGWVAALLLTGCAPVGPTYQPPQPELPAAWSAPVAGIAMPTADPELAHWWTLFNDPRLDSLLKRAVAANRDVKIAEARVQQARAQYRLTTAVVAPNVGVSGAYANNRKSENVGGSGGGTTQDLFQTGFDAGWELDIFGGARRGAEAAEARLAAAGENSGDVLVSLTAEVARNYLDLRGSQQRLLTARANLAGQVKTLALAQGRRESGLGNELEVAQAETQLAMTSSLLSPLESSVGQAIYRLALLLGQPPQGLVDELAVVAPLPELPAKLPETLPSELLRRRPDIRRAERLLAAATADIGVATAELFPHFSLTGLLGLQSLNLSELLSSSSRYWNVGPTIRWSLFNGGRVRANIDLNQARREEAQALYEKTVLTALSEVESALWAGAREEETRRTLAEAVLASRRTLELATGRYRAGLAGMLDVLLGERALYQAQDQLLQSEQRLALNRVALCKALGGGWQVPPAVLPNVLPVATPTSSTPAKEPTP
ncbi:MAG: efflux transporter outer membrane subunit [Desulfobulbaceae bacterium]|nr:efflux transporter outer membrane subunit [Desulfobulbaceae bacterium]